MPKRHRVGKSQASESRLAELEAFYASLPDNVLDSTDDHDSPLAGDIVDLLTCAFVRMIHNSQRPQRGMPERCSDHRSDNSSAVSVSTTNRRQFITGNAKLAKLDTRSIVERKLDKWKRMVQSSIYFDWRNVDWAKVEKARQACESSD